MRSMAENAAIHVTAKYVESRSGADSELVWSVIPASYATTNPSPLPTMAVIRKHRSGYGATLDVIANATCPSVAS